MRLFRKAQVIALLCIVGILSATTLTPVRGIARNFAIEIDASTSGSGSAGTRSIAVAAFFDSATSTGAGGFSGELLQPVLGGLDQRGIFSLIVAALPIHVPPCGPAGEVGASGAIISGSFQGQLVFVFGCIGTHATGGFQIIDRKSGSIIFAGEGFGNTSVSSSPILAGAVFAGNTLGAGSAGSGSLDLGGQLVTTRDNSLQSGGAFVGTLSGPGLVGGTFGVIRFSITVGFDNATVILSGLVTGGSFSGQPLTVSLTLATSTSSGPQPVTVTIVVGSVLNPVYAGHGSGLAAIAIPNLIEA